MTPRHPNQVPGETPDQPYNPPTLFDQIGQTTDPEVNTEQPSTSASPAPVDVDPIADFEAHKGVEVEPFITQEARQAAIEASKDGDDPASEQGHPSPYSRKAISRPRQSPEPKLTRPEYPNRSNPGDPRLNPPTAPQLREEFGILIPKQHRINDRGFDYLKAIIKAGTETQAAKLAQRRRQPSGLVDSRPAQAADDVSVQETTALKPSNPFVSLLNLETFDISLEDIGSPTAADQTRVSRQGLTQALRHGYSSSEHGVINGLAFTEAEQELVLKNPSRYVKSIRTNIKAEEFNTGKLSQYQLEEKIKSSIVSGVTNKIVGMEGLLASIGAEIEAVDYLTALIREPEFAEAEFERNGEDAMVDFIVYEYTVITAMLEAAARRAGWDRSKPKIELANRALAANLFTGTESERKLAWLNYGTLAGKFAEDRHAIVNRKIDLAKAELGKRSLLS